ncbi:DUF6678 family protein [Lysinibacillus sphaericus]|uniref:DUF6678 family protein n=1 Tax=Lysinibacillus sphaericus TaxID=1421 RepID=UPI001C5E5705
MEKLMLNIMNERQLISLMNKTKWGRLTEGIASLAFPPAFQMKLLTEPEPFPPQFYEHITYHGDWQHLETESYSTSNIEWLKIRPYYYKKQGQLLPDQKIDCHLTLGELLKNSNIPFQKENEDYIVFGYVTTTEGFLNDE